jgi:hypothetical protein
MMARQQFLPESLDVAKSRYRDKPSLMTALNYLVQLCNYSDDDGHSHSAFRRGVWDVTGYLVRGDVGDEGPD